ncbi:MAG: 50S ribosomal protein L10 [Candidatus Gracilibacteria bacterium]|nr:50S ribosomal protein L10 [Candidatus Gracilibacteria bacterium]
MAVSKSKKNEILENLKVSIKEAKSVAFTTNNGLTVEEITKLRKNLREINSTFTLAKKTLIKIAFKEVFNVEIEDSILVGQIAVVCSNDDAVGAMGKVNEFMKEFKKNPKIEWAGAFFEGAIKDAEETKVIASIPSREVLLGRLVGSMMSPVSALARFFDAATKKLTDEGLSNLGSSTPAKKETPKVEEKVEETKTEEVKEEVKTEEAPKEEETPTETTEA